MGHARNQRREPALLLRLRRRQRQRAHGASVEGAEERDHLLPLSVVARQLQRSLDRLGARVAVVNLVRPFHGRDLRQSLAPSCTMRFVIEVGARHVNQLGRLLLDGGNHLGMAVAGRGHRNAGSEIEELVAVHVFDDAAAAALRDQRIGARVRRRNVTLVPLQNALGIGAGQRGNDLRSGDVSDE